MNTGRQCACGRVSRASKSRGADGGLAWGPNFDTGLGGPDSRFHIRRLASGRVLLLNHYGFKGRNNLTAMLSNEEKNMRSILPDICAAALRAFWRKQKSFDEMSEK